VVIVKLPFDRDPVEKFIGVQGVSEANFTLRKFDRSWKALGMVKVPAVEIAP